MLRHPGFGQGGSVSVCVDVVQAVLVSLTRQLIESGASICSLAFPIREYIVEP